MDLFVSISEKPEKNIWVEIILENNQVDKTLLTFYHLYNNELEYIRG